MNSVFERVSLLLRRSRSIETIHTAPPHRPPLPVLMPAEPLDPRARFVSGLPGFGSADLVKYNSYGFPDVEGQ